VGDEAVLSGFHPLSGDRDSAMAQARSIAQSLAFSSNKVSGFFVRGPKGESITIEVTAERIPG
jgi:hypothetical protein